MNKLIGIVACEGKSSRMGLDKSLLQYKEKEQRYVCYELLSNFCEEVYISCNSEQAKSIAAGYEYIPDAEEFYEIGPMAALLSAHKKMPDASFFLLGCDYPLLQLTDVKKLFLNRSKNNSAVSYYQEAANLYEPLLAIYENSVFTQLKHNFLQANYSLQYVLTTTTTQQVPPNKLESIKSFDTPEQVESFRFHQTSAIR